MKHLSHGILKSHYPSTKAQVRTPNGMDKREMEMKAWVTKKATLSCIYLPLPFERAS